MYRWSHASDKPFVVDMCAASYSLCSAPSQPLTLHMSMILVRRLTLESQVWLLAIEISLLLWADKQRVTLFSLPSSTADGYLTVLGYRCGRFLSFSGLALVTPVFGPGASTGIHWSPGVHVLSTVWKPLGRTPAPTAAILLVTLEQSLFPTTDLSLV